GAGGALEGRGPLPRLAHRPGARHRGRRGVRRAAPPPLARDVGLPRPARDDHAGALQGALPRRAGELRLPRLPAPGGPGEALPRPRRGGRHRRAAHRGLDDGPRGIGIGARVPSPGGALLRDRAGGPGGLRAAGRGERLRQLLWKIVTPGARHSWLSSRARRSRLRSVRENYTGRPTSLNDAELAPRSPMALRSRLSRPSPARMGIAPT